MKTVMRRTSLAHYEQSDANPGVKRVEEEVVVVHEFDETIVGECPAYGPGIQKHKCEAGDHELRLVGHDCRRVNDPIDGKRVLTTETGLELLFRDACALTGGTGVLSLLRLLAGSFLTVLLIGRPCLILFLWRLDFFLLFSWFLLSRRFRFFLLPRRPRLVVVGRWRSIVLFRCGLFMLRRLGLIARFLRPGKRCEEQKGKRDKRILKLVHGCCSPFPTEFGLPDPDNTQPTQTDHN
jgi:hypothetical protein